MARTTNIPSEQIMAKCPPEINASTISLQKIGGYWKQKNPHHAGRAVAAARKRGSQYFTEESRIKAACVYAMTGSAVKTGEILGIRPGTIRQWKMQPWWQQVIDRIRTEKDDELDVKLTHILDKTVEVINDRLENGDYVYDAKNQELIRKPMGGKETAVVTSIMVDKRQLLRERREQKRDETDVMKRLKDIAQNFAKFVAAKDVTQESLEIVKKQNVEDAEVTIETPKQTNQTL